MSGPSEYRLPAFTQAYHTPNKFVKQRKPDQSRYFAKHSTSVPPYQTVKAPRVAQHRGSNGTGSKGSLSPSGSHVGSSAKEDTVRNNFSFQRATGGSSLPPLMPSESRQGRGRATVNASTSPTAHGGTPFNKS